MAKEPTLLTAIVGKEISTYQAVYDIVVSEEQPAYFETIPNRCLRGGPNLPSDAATGIPVQVEKIVERIKTDLFTVDGKIKSVETLPYYRDWY